MYEDKSVFNYKNKVMLRSHISPPSKTRQKDLFVRRHIDSDINNNNNSNFLHLWVHNKYEDKENNYNNKKKIKRRQSKTTDSSDNTRSHATLSYNKNIIF